MRRNRSYWELRAEQIMDRVFEPLEGSPAHQKTIVTPTLTPKPAAKRWQLTTPTALLIGLTLASAVAGMFSMLLWRSWMQARQDLHQERQLLVLERLRQLGPISPPNPTLIQLPPPLPPQLLPPSEANLPELDAGSFETAERTPKPIRVPIPTKPAAASTSNTATPPLPELLGVVQVPGRGSTAIFNTTNGSVTAAIGDAIGNSGWRLQSASNDQAQISRQGVIHQLSLSSR
ncbi:MAG: hypothetical protein EBQ52_10710 [Synechococcaceae bacterium LLD_019]|nr:hypothetical protein [Synechococcaceae bacterium WB6_1A_059]NBQ19833.1 hypothetical protein [Synechococcaceae bacterium WB5_2A_257]NBY60602.1 hypothetical protein [Synechococcaceae bacterium LLD_019]NCU77082.1 hypothetical protein [Synechococcaceae bacterium WB7_1C_051]NCU90948.1 hypothetical protein [Synechococcaceae bacterium WB7_1B_046]NDG01832.1 hypothetical protein [Synechococcaceae bacterium WBB_34_004]NDG78559.1 hypothetical protein [Synechococcaceae bacterium WB8_1B_057]